MKSWIIFIVTPLRNNWMTIFDENGEFAALQDALIQWCQSSEKPIVLFIDEVSALAAEVCFEMNANRQSEKEITPDMMLQAKENLILRRGTHLDQLMDKLQEERIRNSSNRSWPFPLRGKNTR